MKNKQCISFGSFYYPLIIFVLFLLLFFSMSIKNKNYLVDKTEVTNYNDGWSLNGAEITLPNMIKEVSANQTLTITRKIDSNLAGKTLLFRTENIFVSVFVEKEYIYEFGFNESEVYGKASGSLYNFVDIPDNSKGKMLTIIYTYCYNSNAGELPSIGLGDRATLVIHEIMRNLLSSVADVLILLVGLIMLSTFFVLRTRSKDITDSLLSLKYIGIFAINFGIWSLTETIFFQLLIQDPWFGYYVYYLSAMLFPIPIFFYIKEVLFENKKKILNMYLWVYWVIFVIAIIIHFFNIYSLRESYDFMEYYLVVEVVLVCIYYIQIVLKKGYLKKIDWCGIFVLALLVVFDEYLDNILKIHNAPVLRFGILVYLFYISTNKIIIIARLIRLGNEAKEYKLLAFCDSLTGAKNRLAFNNRIKDINSADLSMVLFDLNSLKYHNDTFGHEAGDVLIKGAADIITTSFKGYSECYRIGGDEFAVLFERVDKKDCDNCLEVLLQMVDTFNINNKYKLQLSYGYAESSGIENYEEVFNRADTLMYEHKVSLKAQRLV